MVRIPMCANPTFKKCPESNTIKTQEKFKHAVRNSDKETLTELLPIVEYKMTNQIKREFKLPSLGAKN